MAATQRAVAGQYLQDSGNDFIQFLAEGGVVLFYVDSTGAVHSTGGVSPSQSLAVASQPSFRLTDSELTSSFAGSTTVSGSIAAVRGNITQSAGNTLAGGFEYGVQGKLTLAGTLANGSGFNAGIFGQVDTSAAGFVHTSGYLAPIMGDFGATSIMASDANAYMIALLNTTNCIIEAGVLFTGNASNAMAFNDLAFGGKHFIITAAVGGSNTKKLAVLIDGTQMFIPLYTA